MMGSVYISVTVKTILVFISLFSSTLFALDRPHTFGLEIHVGGVDAKQAAVTAELNDVDTLHYMLRYDYRFSEEFSLGIAYLDGDSSDFTFIFGLFTDSSLEYDALMLNAKYQFPISKKSRLFLQASGLQYDFDITDDGAVVGSDDGSDYALSAGWAIKLNSGLGLQVGYNYMRLGSDLRIRSTNFGINYSF